MKTPLNEERDETKERNERKTRKRSIIWFKPPFSVNVTTNIGKMFLGFLLLFPNRQEAAQNIK